MAEPRSLFEDAETLASNLSLRPLTAFEQEQAVNTILAVTAEAMRQTERVRYLLTTDPSEWQTEVIKWLT